MRRVLRLGAKYSPEYDRPAMSQLRRNGALSRVSRQRQRIRPIYLAARHAIWQVEDLELTSTKTSAGDCIVDHIFYGLFHETILPNRAGIQWQRRRNAVRQDCCGKMCRLFSSNRRYNRGQREGFDMRITKSLRASCLAAFLFCAVSGWTQPSGTSVNSNLLSKPRVEIHCAAGVCTTSIDPSSLPSDVRSDLARHGVDLSRPLVLRNLGKWAGILSDRTCYTMRSYLMMREDRHSDSTRQVGYSVCEPSSTFDVRETVEPEP